MTIVFSIIGAMIAGAVGAVLLAILLLRLLSAAPLVGYGLALGVSWIWFPAALAAVAIWGAGLVSASYVFLFIYVIHSQLKHG